MIRWGLLALLASCVSSNSIECDFGVCPNGTACDNAHHLCVAPDQLTACAGIEANQPCDAAGVSGVCIDDVCLPIVCGDGIVEPGEMCDDGNHDDGDSCSADCSTDFTCGNGVVDTNKGEECDDSGRDDHDGCSHACLRESPVWIEHTLTVEPRQDAAYTYDPFRDRIVMFGGFDNNPGGNTLGDTLEWNGAEWLKMPTSAAPASRTNAAMSFDQTKHVMMFGGRSGNAFLGDTWTWDGVGWTPAILTSAPKARAGSAIAYDSRRKRAVLFGGFDTAGTLADTWEWDGSQWTSLQPAHHPSQRKYAAATYDPIRGVVVLTAGIDTATPLDDTWTFDGTDWTDVTSGAVGTRPQVQLGNATWDLRTQRVVLFGGINGSLMTQVWAWNGTAWSAITTTGAVVPTGRASSVFASTKDHIVQFSGSAPGGDSPETWFLTTTTWTKPIEPGPRSNFGMVNEAVRGRVLVYAGTLDTSLTRSPDTVAVTASGYAVIAGSPPSARALPCVAYDYARDEVVMFGGSTGTSGGQLNGETWTWNGSGWMSHTPAMSPSPRVDATCAFDGAHVTLVGGNAGGTPQADAWSWTGTTWTPVTMPADYLGRYGASAAYDPIRKRLVLFGGLNLSIPFDDTWTYDGTTSTWHLETTPYRPPGRFEGAMTWFPARKSVLLVGGLGFPASLIDAYEWDGTKWHVVPSSTGPRGRSELGLSASLDGQGVFLYGGQQAPGGPPFKDRWELTWIRGPSERCGSADTDGDGKTACEDSDCWATCSPACPPGTSCDTTAPRCGDGTCDAAREDCHSCAADCSTCAPACGDGICDPGETCAGDCP